MEAVLAAREAYVPGHVPRRRQTEQQGPTEAQRPEEKGCSHGPGKIEVEQERYLDGHRIEYAKGTGGKRRQIRYIAEAGSHDHPPKRYAALGGLVYTPECAEETEHDEGCGEDQGPHDRLIHRDETPALRNPKQRP